MMISENVNTSKKYLVLTILPWVLVVSLTVVIVILLLPSRKIPTETSNSQGTVEQPNQTKEVKEKPIQTAQTKQVTIGDLLFTIDEERTGSQVCGYDFQTEIAPQLTPLTHQELNISIDEGVWSFDCMNYVYGVQIGHPAIPSNSKEGKYVGIWLYNPFTKSNTKLVATNTYTKVYRFITNNLVSAGDSLIDISSKKVITKLLFLQSGDSTGDRVDWIAYRNPKFPWTFSYPSRWEVVEEDIEFDASSKKITKLVLEYQGVKVALYSQNPNLSLENYATNYVNYGGKYNYKHFYAEDVVGQPTQVYLQEKTNPKYPNAIVISGNGDPSESISVNNYLIPIFPTFRQFK